LNGSKSDTDEEETTPTESGSSSDESSELAYESTIENQQINQKPDFERVIRKKSKENGGEDEMSESEKLSLKLSQSV